MTKRQQPASLANAVTARRLDAEARARKAIAEMNREGVPVSFAAVAARAGVSRQFLYQHDDFRPEIEELRSSDSIAPNRLPVRERGSESSVRTRLRTALQDNQRLREENTALREELAIAHGRTRELELERNARR